MVVYNFILIEQTLSLPRGYGWKERETSSHVFLYFAPGNKKIKRDCGPFELSDECPDLCVLEAEVAEDLRKMG